jgi:hypothetical protein
MPLIIAAGIGAVGSLLGGIGKNKAAKAQEKAAKQNAALATRNAQLTREGTEIDLMRMERAGNLALGEQRATAGASNLKTEGSALDILRSSTSAMALDRSLRSMQGQIDASGWEMKATDYLAGAKAAKAEGTAAIIGGVTGAAKSMLGAF